MYDKYVGKMSDEELLLLEGKYSNSKRMIAEYIIQRNKEQ